MSELRRRWRIFYRFWCGGLAYWIFGQWVPEIGGHRWVYEDGHCKRTCSRCDQHEWVFSRRFPQIGEAASHWAKMNGDEWGLL